MNDATTDARPEAFDRVALYPRHDETFPLLTAEEIDRLRRFGTERHYRAGEALFIAGEPAPGMFVVLDGMVTITQRDGFGRRQPVVEQGPGQFLAEAGTLSGRPALVDGHAEGDVTAILIPPPGLRALLVAEATLGERITRALILRRQASSATAGRAARCCPWSSFPPARRCSTRPSASSAAPSA